MKGVHMQYQVDLLSKPALSITEVSQILGLSYQTIRRRISIGEFKTAPHSGNQKILIYTDSVIKYLNNDSHTY